ncbi:putative addiction module antidote protein [Bifidobacterium sp. MA2]|uniref:Addiction module antidote protein n=1 Tax=Bifidobacterium santillanense TaxID=2809028 RepID=A0ABS5UM39_9BIFI|nr:putative addiction module antidote protein [Bifidobacterium santillanense]
MSLFHSNQQRSTAGHDPQRLQGATATSTEFTDYDTSEYLESERDVIAYLNAVAEYNDPALMQVALGNVARARGMTQIAGKAGVGSRRPL